jgi:coenzyme Q-binding protein COQ10
MPTVCYEIETDVQPEDLMAVITDFARYPDFIPTMKQVRLALQGPPVWEVRFILQIIRRMEYVLRLEQHGPHELSWSLLEGVFLHNSGSWKLKPLDSGTHICYTLTMQLETFLPNSIALSLEQHSLPATVGYFIEEARRRHARQRSAPAEH